jgi:hypothetical protein
MVHLGRIRRLRRGTGMVSDLDSRGFHMDADFIQERLRMVLP